MVDNNRIKKDWLECDKIIEQIRADINSKKCQTCCSCNKLTDLYQALISLSESIREIFPMEAEFLQAYLISLVGVQKIPSYDFGGIMAVVNIIGAKYVDYIDSTTSISVNSTLGEFYQFNLSSCIRQQNSLTAQFVSFSFSNLANIFYTPQFLQ